MKDLIKELKNNKLDIEKHNELFASAWNSSIDNCCSVLNQHNLITAPKQIKLSEVVSRLKETFKDLCKITYRDLRVINHGLIYLEDEIVVTIDKEKNIILNIEFSNTFIELKWLYVMWIAGTEIVDDMEEKEHEKEIKNNI